MSADRILFRNTGAGKGRRILIGPDNTALKYLSCGRIILGEGERASASSKDREVALICLKGAGAVSVDSTLYRLRRYDALYVPPGRRCHVEAEGDFDLVECSAPSESDGPVQRVAFDSVRNDAALRVTAGGEASTREVYRLIDANVQASRLVCGLTFGRPGHWTSWSPHEHAASREEIYLYIDMPRPGFGVQMIYTDLEKADFVVPVFEDDAVVITRGYHPNVGIPGCGINYVWMMAGLRPGLDREWSDMNFQPEFVARS